ncbi:MAG TPA: diacylglycerol kinase [Desulfobacteraceae bacterium]|nr:diacylglycerol kinase [Desulfobacteraceae bacterium]
MKPHNATGLTRLFRAFQWSWKGIKHAFVNEAAFREEVLVTCLLGPLGFWLGNTPVEKILLVGSLCLVLTVELLNSSLEAVVDRIGEEPHPLAGHAKDMGSAAVFVSLFNAAVVWGCLLLL